MISNIISRAACLAELTSNPKSFFNCPDMHGGPGLPEGARSEERSSQGANFTAGAVFGGKLYDGRSQLQVVDLGNRRDALGRHA